MGTGYTRNDSSNNIADGNVINASDLDGEYDAIESAFGTSGHTHDGTSGEGGPVTVLGPVQDFVASASEIKPKTDNTLDIGTSSLEFKNLYLDGLAYIDGLGETMLVSGSSSIQFRDTAISINSSTDGQLDIDADTEIEITSPTVDINASTVVNISTDLIVGDDLTLQSDAAVLNFGVNSDVSLTHVHDTGLLLNAGSAIQFRDAALAINSSADGQLDIIADTQLEITTPTLELNSDAQIIAIGADGDVTVTHEADTGLKMKAASGFELNLQTGDTSVESGNVLGKITFNAPSESSGSDALLDGAAIEAVAEGTFSSTVNTTKLSFKTGASEAATEKMSLSSGGALSVTGALTAGGILKTDDTTDATSTTDGSLQTDGGLSVVKKSVFGDDITVNSATSPQIKIGPTDATAAFFLGDANRSSAGQHLAEYQGYWNGTLVGRMVVVSGADTTNKDDGHLDFYTTPSGGSSTRAMRIDSSQNVGIGTTSPSSTLAVETSSIASLSSYAGHIVIGPSTRSSSSGDYSGGILFDQANGVQVSGTKGASILGFQDGSDVNSMGITFNVHGTDGSANRFEAMRINSDGNVGIGQSPASSSDNFTVLGNYMSNFMRNVTSGNRGYDINIGAVNGSGTNIIGATIVGEVISGDADGEFAIETRTSGSVTEKMRINQNGQMGILMSPLDTTTGSGSGASLGAGFSTLAIKAHDTRTQAISIDATNAAGPNFMISSYSDGSGSYYMLGANLLLATDGSVAYETNGENMSGIMLDSRGGNGIQFYTAAHDGSSYVPDERMRIDNAGNVMIGTTTEGVAGGENLTIADTGEGGMTIRTGTSSKGNIYFSDSTSGDSEYEGIIRYDHNGDYMTFATASTHRMRLTTDGRLGIGTTSPYAILQTEQDVAGEATALALVNNNVDGASDSVCISFGLARDNGYLFGFKAIKWIKEQAWTTTASTVDAALTFSTVENETLSERVRITAAGVFTANNVDASGSFAVISTGANGARGFAVHSSGTTVIQNDDSLDTGPALLIGRVNHDNGDQIVRFGVNGTSDIGNITESGGTVSYNAFMGSHITQTVPSDTLEGTVLESTGELIDSTDEDYKGYVEQKRLTKCKVSDTEDSPNVFGVWQVESKTGVQFASSLGAYFVRVHSGETVSLGDLLSSKGNGTAKVQSDDIIRSKTIGKVTSLTKKTTYSDGSYLLPCVLYCG